MGKWRGRQAAAAAAVARQGTTKAMAHQSQSSDLFSSSVPLKMRFQKPAQNRD